MAKDIYGVSGVDLDLGNEASNVLFEASKHTWKNRDGKVGQIRQFGSGFRGARGVRFPADAYTGSNDDGAGTKVESAERTGFYETMAFDLLAMLCDDAVRHGKEPVYVTTTLDVNSLQGNIDKVKALARGLVEAAEYAGVAVLDGETAELGDRIGGYGNGFHFNWAGTVTWVCEPEKLLTGEKVRPGDYIVAFKETGFRSNGISLVRKILSGKYGAEWHKQTLNCPPHTWGFAVMEPSRIYTPAWLDMIGRYGVDSRIDAHALVHVTGGGIPEKLGSVLAVNKVGAELDNLFEPCNAMLCLQAMSENVPAVWDKLKGEQFRDAQFYEAWNMGNGGLGIAGYRSDAEKMVSIAKIHGIEARIAGAVTEQPGIRIKSHGIFNPCDELPAFTKYLG